MTEETNITSQEVEVVPQPKRKPAKKKAEGISATKPAGRGNGTGNLKKDKIGTPTLGRPANYVTRVGLGNLEVVSAEGLKDE